MMTTRAIDSPQSSVSPEGLLVEECVAESL